MLLLAAPAGCYRCWAMRSLGIVLSLAAIAVASPAMAEVVTIPIPELAGQTNFTGTIPFSLPSAPSVIRSVSIRVVAMAEPGTFYCNSNAVTYPWLTSIHAFLLDPAWTNWSAGPASPSTSGSYDVTQEFHPTGYDPPWDFLLDGQAQLEFTCAPGVTDLYCTGPTGPSTPPLMHLQEVDLIIDADFSVPTLSQTWGRIKALYH